MQHANIHKNAGFTLVELSIVLVILSIIVASILSIVTQKGAAENIRAANAQMDKVETSIQRYVAQHGYLPCPAPMNAAENSAAFGFSTDCNIANVAGETWETGAGVNTIRMGALPTRDLALPDTLMHDPWKGRITYTVIKELAVDSARFDSFTTTATDGVIGVNDEHGNRITIATPAGTIAYFVLSFGKDKNGAYTRAGTLGETCAAGTAQTENCDFTGTFDNVYIDGVANYSDIAANYYDDFTRWKTYNHIRAYK